MTRWIVLVAAVCCEVAGSLSLRAAIEDPRWFALVAVAYVAAFTLLREAMRRGMPLGVAYGVWGALGVALTALMSAAVFGEQLTPMMLLGMLLVIGGVLCIELGSHTARRGRPDEAGRRPGGEVTA
ncbi:multidrug efflux SMR transporter [Kocuria palustris]|uniref:DMT family transporter n=1 Tax=Kocuria palustris TaxID=71999 RepID=UPI0011A7DF9E|nr:multidrug efflux SMR transporter [Kocuria palustris]